MARVTVNVHDASPELYAALGIPEEDVDECQWKVLATDSIEITFFRPDGYGRELHVATAATPEPELELTPAGLAWAVDHAAASQAAQVAVLAARGEAQAWPMSYRAAAVRVCNELGAGAEAE